MPDIRAYLRAHPFLSTFTAGRVFFRLPDRISAAPFMRIYRSGGAVQLNSEVPLSDIRIAIEVWGQQNSDYGAVRGTVKAIEAIGHELVPGTVLGPNGTACLNINVTTAVDSPDPDTGWPRVVIDSIWTVRL